MGKIKSASKFLLEYAIYLFIVSYPFSIRVNSAAGIIMITLSLLSTDLPAKISRLKTQKNLLILVGYFLLLCIGLLYSSDQQTALTVLEKSMSFLFFPLFLATVDPFECKQLDIINWVFIGTIASAVLACLIGNVLFFIKNHLEFRYFFYWEHAYDNLTDYIGFHPTYFSLLILVGMVLIVFNISWEGPIRKVCLSFFLLFLTGFLFLLGAKIGIALLFILTTVIGFRFMRRNKMWALYLSIAIVLLVIVAYQTPVTYWRFRNAFESATNTIGGKDLSDYRIMHWRCSWMGIREHPFFGVGTGDFQSVIDNCYREFGLNELFGFNSHNQFMDGWLAMGLPGLLVTVLCFVIPLRDALQRKNRSFMLIMVFFLITALTESIFWTQKGIVLFCFLLCIFYGQGWPSPRKTIKSNF